MNKLPIEIIRNIYLYDSTYRDEFERSLVRIKVDFYLYKCPDCYKKWQKCSCYCPVCKTYKRFCQQIYYEPGDIIEDTLSTWVQMTI
jgi:hypothetical protein